MIPHVEEYEIDAAENMPSRDYCYDIESNRINGTVDDIEAVRQAIYFMLNTERYDYIIYSWDYGVEFKHLIGMPMDYVEPEAERVITECLTSDDRIESVADFVFDKIGSRLHITFNVSTIYGHSIESEVDIDV